MLWLPEWIVSSWLRDTPTAVAIALSGSQRISPRRLSKRNLFVRQSELFQQIVSAGFEC
jgi:hypothetical protein